MNAIADVATLALGGLLLLAALLAALGAVLGDRTDPALRERRRRLGVHARGRTADAMITETRDDLLYYSYTVRGVQYTASQDVSSLRASLPQDLSLLVGPAILKYAPDNPANSILICEEWSGFELRRAPSL